MPLPMSIDPTLLPHRGAALAAVLAFVLAGCGSDPPGEPPIPAEPPVVSIQPHVDSITTAGGVLFTATVTDSAGDPVPGPALTWTSADTLVARADEDGWIRGRRPGTTMVYARVNEGVDSSSITVIPSVSAIEISLQDTLVGLGGSVQLTARLTDSLGNLLTGRFVRWRSADSTWSPVDSNGRVTVRFLNTATVSASSGLQTATVQIRAGERYGSIVTLKAGVCAVTLAGATVCFGEAANYGSGSPCDNLPYPGGGCPMMHAMPAPIDTLLPTVTSEYLTCALTGGTAICWGSNPEVDLPYTGSTQRTGPHPLQGLPTLDELKMGRSHACGRSGTSVLCWGTGAVGRPGCTTTDAPCAPGVVPGIMAIQVSVGQSNSCAVTTGQQVACWGALSLDSMGVPITSITPVVMDSIAGATAIAVVEQGPSACALASGGAVWCWGANNYRILGDGDPVAHLTPRRVTGLPPLTSLDGGGRSFCGLDATGGAWCWGMAGYAAWDVPLVNSVPCGGSGELCRLGATHLAPSLSFTELSLGILSTCGMATDGFAYCWGWDGVRVGGQSGDDPTKALGQRP